MMGRSIFLAFAALILTYLSIVFPKTFVGIHFELENNLKFRFVNTCIRYN